MSYPPIDLLGPTYLAIHWGWLLVTLGNFTVYVLLAVVFVIGATVRLPGARKDLARAKAANLRRPAAPGAPAAGPKGGPS